MADIIAIGELLIDFTPKAARDSTGAITHSAVFERNPGGAPANVAVQAAKLGSRSAFIGKVGNDDFGRFLIDTLKEAAVETKGVAVDDNSDTTLAFVRLDETGNRTFTFYRRNTADTRLLESDIDYSLIDSCKLLHFGSLSFTDEPSKATVLQVVEYAKKHADRKIISYDPNWRPMLWKSAEQGLDGMKLGLKYCDILKVSDEELKLLTNCDEIELGLRLLHDSGIAIVIVTMGAEGCILCAKKQTVRIPTYNVNVVDTTGAGDSFFGAFLHRIVAAKKDVEDFSFDELTKFAYFANAAGALCAAKYGAIPAMPDLTEINYIMR